MYINANVDFPYISDLPLSADTKWVAIPVFVSVKSKDFLTSSRSAKEILFEAYNSLKNLDSKSINTSLLEFDKKFAELKAILELIRVNNNECQANIFNYFINKFSGEGDFWEKIEHLSMSLDSLYGCSFKYKSDKQILVQSKRQPNHTLEFH